MFPSPEFKLKIIVKIHSNYRPKKFLEIAYLQHGEHAAMYSSNPKIKRKTV